MSATKGGPTVFKRATRETVKARIAIQGPTGSGKTYSALGIATGLAGDGKVAVIDTEKGSASTYANRFDFDVLELGPPFDPDRYVAAIEEASRAGYAVIVVDSLSHAWFDEGGVLDIVDKASARTGNKFAAWASGTPKQNALINAVVRCPVHIIATIRSKMEYAQEKDDKGRSVVRKIGLGPVQRDNVEYEFAIVGEIALDHSITFTKSRFEALQDKSYNKPGADLGRTILAELQGTEPEVLAGGGGQPGTTATTAPRQASTTSTAGTGGRSRAKPTTPVPAAPQKDEWQEIGERVQAGLEEREKGESAARVTMSNLKAWLSENVTMGMLDKVAARTFHDAMYTTDIHDNDRNVILAFINSGKIKDLNTQVKEWTIRLHDIIRQVNDAKRNKDLNEALPGGSNSRAVRRWPNKMTGRY